VTYINGSYVQSNFNIIIYYFLINENNHSINYLEVSDIPILSILFHPSASFKMASSRALTKEEKKRTAQKKIQVKASLAVCTWKSPMHKQYNVQLLSKHTSSGSRS
jgi:hypothetical protein